MGEAEQVSAWTAAAKKVLLNEAGALTRSAELSSAGIARACELILSQPGKVIVSGMGKSGHVGRKIAATLCSVGTSSVFVHPSEAVHGDLGVYSPGDPTILLSKSGATSELINLVPILRAFGSRLVGILGNVTSPLADMVDVAIDGSVQSEADSHNLAPTSSSTVAMAIGDAIAIVLMQAKKFSPTDFAKFHPGGQLGRNLNLCVSAVMKSGGSLPLVNPDDTMKDVIIAMTHKPLGAACVVDSDHKLMGIITDGDIRRALLHHDDIHGCVASEIMTSKPVTVTSQALLVDALALMENRPSKLSVLPVVEDGVCVGLVQIHDVYSQ